MGGEVVAMSSNTRGLQYRCPLRCWPATAGHKKFIVVWLGVKPVDPRDYMTLDLDWLRAHADSSDERVDSSLIPAVP